MAEVKVKICGITNIEDALHCARAGADYLGFIFYRKSPRYVSTIVARDIISKLPASVIPVGVFVNEERSVITSTIVESGIRLLQLSGDERPEDCDGHALPVWKAFRFRDSAHVRNIASYRLDAAMLDGARDGLYGGTGSRADDSIAREMKQHHRLVLAGGLSPENLLDAIASVWPFAVDVNSGVESAPGLKDAVRVAELFHCIEHTKDHLC